MPSRAPRLGASVERQVADERNLELERTSWYDAKTSDGDIVSIKGAIRERKSGRPGRFRLFYESHKKVAKNDGWYLFAAYEDAGQGAKILDTKMVRARSLRLSADDFGPTGHQRGQHCRLSIDDIFG